MARLISQSTSCPLPATLKKNTALFPPKYIIYLIYFPSYFVHLGGYVPQPNEDPGQIEKRGGETG